MTMQIPPLVGEVWGNPRDPKTWRIVVAVKSSWINYTKIGYPYQCSDERRDWNQWYVETGAWNITGMVLDYLQRHEADDLQCADCGGTGSPSGEAAGMVCGNCMGTGIQPLDEPD